jgi:hypothetical protein
VVDKAKAKVDETTAALLDATTLFHGVEKDLSTLEEQYNDSEPVILTKKRFAEMMAAALAAAAPTSAKKGKNK